MKPKKADRIAWGSARVSFLANLESIKRQRTSGWPLSHIYREYKDRLGGMSYRQFTHYAAQYIGPFRAKTTEKTDSPTRQVENSEGFKPKRFDPGPRIPNLEDLV